jgi:Putative bacterial sensory transduction regulator
VRRVIACVAMAMVGAALGQAQCNTRVGDYLKQSGYSFTSAQNCKYWINQDTLSIPRQELQGAILVADENDGLVIGAVVRLKASLELSTANLTRLLKLNHELDYLKVGIDKQGDLFVRAEIDARCIDAEQFKARLKDVIDGANKAYEATR